MTITTCLLTRNHADCLGQALKSVATVATELLVADTGSTDGTVDLLRSYPHLQWVSEKDRGHYDAMNKGIKRTSGDIVAILNADDCYRPNALSEVATAFTKHPDWDALFCDIVYVDDTEWALARGFFDCVGSKTYDSRDDKKCSAILPGDANVGNNS